MKRLFLLTLLWTAACLAGMAQPFAGNPDLSDGDTYGYLYVHRSEHGGWPAFALTQDGIHFHDLLCGDSVFPTGTENDMYGKAPYICRTVDGYFLMASAARESGFDLYGSYNLTDWSRVAVMDFPGQFRMGDVKVIRDKAYTAPDGTQDGYLVYFTMLEPTKTDHAALFGVHAGRDLTGWTRPQLIADWGFGLSYAELGRMPDTGEFFALLQEEGKPGFMVSVAPSLGGPWSDPVSFDPEDGRTVKNPTAFRLAGAEGWQIGYAIPGGGPTDGYRICSADNLMERVFRPQFLEGVYGPDQGSFIRISEQEYKHLQAWSDAAEPSHLAPDVHNPVFPGLHADPEVLYSEQTGKYYIYPTTDGAYAWHNHDFKCFSSEDLVNWKDEGVILDLQDLDWGKEYAWAPCIIEKKVGAGYKYYYYFVANKSVGVAVADRPEGPYRDALGRPLLSQEEINSPNQVIDPDVFRDPRSGKYYLYWGNSYLWMAELADDMVSLVPGTMHELIPRSRIGEYHYLEGTYVFERNGLYYFMCSENITRSARYCIRYLISDSPTEFVRNGQPAKVEEQIILQQDPSLQIFGTGHNSVINVPGTDDWYMVYHRFTRPEGIKMGLSGGYNREVCIDPMYFNPDGTIIPVKPTL